MDPTTRPTEWISAVAGIITAIALWTQNKDTAALVTAIGGFVPGLLTALVEWYRRRQTPALPPAGAA